MDQDYDDHDGSSFIQMIDIKSFGKPLKVSGRTACTARERTQLDLNGN